MIRSEMDLGAIDFYTKKPIAPKSISSSPFFILKMSYNNKVGEWGLFFELVNILQISSEPIVIKSISNHEFFGYFKT